MVTSNDDNKSKGQGILEDKQQFVSEEYFIKLLKGMLSSCTDFVREVRAYQNIDKSHEYRIEVFVSDKKRSSKSDPQLGFTVSLRTLFTPVVDEDVDVTWRVL